jgi:hypothetical protein
VEKGGEVMGVPTQYYYGKRADMFEADAQRALVNNEKEKASALIKRAHYYRNLAGQFIYDNEEE